MEVGEDWMSRHLSSRRRTSAIAARFIIEVRATLTETEIKPLFVCVCTRRGWPGSNEAFNGHVCQAPPGNRLWRDHHPDLVDALLPGQRHIVIDPPQQLGNAFHFDLFAGATNKDTPSRSTGVIDVIDLEGDAVAPQPAHFGSVLRAEHDVLSSNGIVDRNGCWSQVVRIHEPADCSLPEHRETLVPGQLFEGSP
jgi:hypothetical protein